MTEAPENNLFKLAADIVRYTSQSVFLTGKAGTGKTTFLHHIRNHTDKNVIVAAPTGVAAINAGGVTLHSLLQLPFEPFIPNFEGKKKLDYHFKLRKSKIEMLRELDLLIIDEVSMLRADMLDAIDYMLRRYRNNQAPFGGVQILFIGDLFQLPPVVQNAEWEQLKHYYPSLFFFHAQVLVDYPLVSIELKKVYRQQDQLFIDILNRIRNNNPTKEDLQLLNRRYAPTFSSTPENRYIVLCTHNYKADRINNEELSRLPGKEYIFKGEVKGDFLETALPTEKELILKEGAQIMFVKNDAGENRRYYNGKLATIIHLDEEKIRVRFENDEEMDLEPDCWQNVRYTLNEESGEIEEEELGSFTQYPVRLAWAITIHKSQGLTFDRVIIDAGQAFAAGQVYVALSRCTTLDGIVLYSRITTQSISTNPYALEFTAKDQDLSFLTDVLEKERPRYCAGQLKKYFDWSPCIRSIHTLNELAHEKKIPNQSEVQSMMAQISSRALEQQEFAGNFIREIDRILSMPAPDMERLKERVQRAAMYFHKDVQEYIIIPIEEHLNEFKKKARVKAYLKKATEIYQTLLRQLEKIEHIRYGEVELTSGLVFNKIGAISSESEIIEASKKKPQKGDSQRITLTMFLEGKSVKEIATERNLSTTTIEGHLVSFILTKELSITQIVPEQKVAYMIPVLENRASSLTLTEMKELLPAECSYMDVKAVLNHLKILKQSQ